VGRVDDAVALVVVQVGAGLNGDAAGVHGFVEAFHQRGIGPRLVRRVNDLALPAAKVGADQRVFHRRLHLVPLLELDDDDVLGVVVIPTGQADIDALGALRNVKLNSHAHVVRNLGVAEHLRHVPERIAP
jgi:hypothetical protein